MTAAKQQRQQRTSFETDESTRNSWVGYVGDRLFLNLLYRLHATTRNEYTKENISMIKKKETDELVGNDRKKQVELDKHANKLTNKMSLAVWEIYIQVDQSSVYFYKSYS